MQSFYSISLQSKVSPALKSTAEFQAVMCLLQEWSAGQSTVIYSGVYLFKDTRLCFRDIQARLYSDSGILQQSIALKVPTLRLCMHGLKEVRTFVTLQTVLEFGVHVRELLDDPDEWLDIPWRRSALAFLIGQPFG